MQPGSAGSRQVTGWTWPADLTGRLPQVFTALRTGAIDLGRARIITEGTRSLDPDLRVTVADKVLDRAPGQTPSALRSAAARAVHVIDPSGVEKRHQRDLNDRKVILTPRDNGMSELWAFLPADGAAAIMASLHRLAEASHTSHDKKSGDRRSADQRRADALIDLATAYLDTHPALHTPSTHQARAATPKQTLGPPQAPPPRPGPRPPAWTQVQVVLPANLLTGHGPEPAEVVGYGPIPTSMPTGSPATRAGNGYLPTPPPGP